MALAGIRSVKPFIHSKASALFLYLLLNLALTLLNKLLLQKAKAPYLLTACHTLASWTGSKYLNKSSQSRRRIARLQIIDHAKLLLFSALYCLNIGVSNLSLQLTPLPLHQILRATTPAITAALLRTFSPGTRYSLAAYLSLVLITLGVILATGSARGAGTESGLASDPSSLQRSWSWSSHAAPRSAVFLTFVGAVLASLKSITTSLLQKPKHTRVPATTSTTTITTAQMTTLKDGLGLNASEIIAYISPLAFVQSLFYASAAGELHHILHLSSTHLSTPPPSSVEPDNPDPMNSTAMSIATFCCLILINCTTAFALNMASFEANRRCGPLGMTIAANLKQVLILALACVWSGPEGQQGASLHLQQRQQQQQQQAPKQRLTWSRSLGIIATVLGSYWFVVEERKRTMVEI